MGEIDQGRDRDWRDRDRKETVRGIRQNKLDSL